jgi:crossover junction endodeoxyribonuclease RuvC
VRTDASGALADRLEAIFTGIGDVIDRNGVDCIVVEGVFYSRNARTALILGHTRGVILLAARMRHLEIHEYSPASIKKAIVGVGGATKEQVQFMLTQLLHLRAAPQPSDAADAVAAALMHVHGARLAELASQKAVGFDRQGGAGAPAHGAPAHGAASRGSRPVTAVDAVENRLKTSP